MSVEQAVPDDNPPDELTEGELAELRELAKQEEPIGAIARAWLELEE